MIRYNDLAATSARACVATLTIALVAAEPPPASAQLPVRLVRPAPQLRAHPTFASARRRVTSYKYTPPTCSENYTSGEYFVGVSEDTSPNYADGRDSAALGGQLDDACGAYSAIGNGYMNIVGADSGEYAFIGSGRGNASVALDSFVGSGFYNEVAGSDSFIGSGKYNLAEGVGSFVGGGDTEYYQTDSTSEAGGGNDAAGIDSFVGGGDVNRISTNGNGSFIGGGGYTYAATGAAAAGNTVSAADAFVGAGDQNANAGAGSFIGAGTLNSISSAASSSAVVGGIRNSVSGEYASILGGFSNTASGSYAIVTGGDGNTAAGTLSFAAGYHADAAHNGSFVWSDYKSGSAVVSDAAVDQFVARASGGVYFYSNEGATSGVVLSPGSGTWASVSDRNAKTAIARLDDASILAKVAALPIDAWQYKSENGVRHIGPMAQDFYAAFGTGADNRHITSIDEDGVALSAIKALHARVARDEAGDRRKDREIADLRAQVQQLAAAVTALRTH